MAGLVVFCRGNEIAVDLGLELFIQAQAGVQRAVIPKQAELGRDRPAQGQRAGQAAAALAVIVNRGLQGAEGLRIADVFQVKLEVLAPL